MSQRSDYQGQSLFATESHLLSKKIEDLIQRIAAIEAMLMHWNSGATPEEADDPIRQITELLTQLVQNGSRQEALLLEIRQELDSATVGP